MNTRDYSADSRINLVCEKFEAHWKHGETSPSLSKFLSGENEDLGLPLLKELLKLDIFYRKKSIPCLSPDIYTVLGKEAVVFAKTILEDSDNGLGFDDIDATRALDGKNPSETKGEIEISQLNRPGSKRIGRYKLLQKIGEGGMGAVWMAEQEEPVKRRVAIKLIKSELATDRDLSLIHISEPTRPY